jgi:hypothetical protein
LPNFLLSFLNVKITTGSFVGLVLLVRLNILLRLATRLSKAIQSE